MVLTIGHSTRPVEIFLNLLAENAVQRLVDVRTIPRSRHNPQFNAENLHQTLATAGIEYTHLKELGGLRHAKANSPNSGWKNPSFRGYADYMQTPEFDAAITKLLNLAATGQVAIMCAEALPWRCHRSLIADALVARGIPVAHIMGPGKTQPHALTSFGVVEGTRVLYP